MNEPDFSPSKHWLVCQKLNRVGSAQFVYVTLYAPLRYFAHDYCSVNELVGQRTLIFLLKCHLLDSLLCKVCQLQRCTVPVVYCCSSSGVMAMQLSMLRQPHVFPPLSSVLSLMCCLCE